MLEKGAVSSEKVKTKAEMTQVMKNQRLYILSIVKLKDIVYSFSFGSLPQTLRD